jgi:copper transporter 1
MMWNWNTIDACFITKSWHITSVGMFAGSCIGVVFLVVLLEFLRRATKEYDRYLVRKRQHEYAALAAAGGNNASQSSDGHGFLRASVVRNAPKAAAVASPEAMARAPPFHPTILEQAARALLHTSGFIVAYFVML